MGKVRGNSGILQRMGPLVGLILIVFILSMVNSDFLTVSNIFNVLRQVSINALIAYGMTFVILTGGIDLSVGSIIALSSAFAAGMMASGTNSWLAIGIGVLSGTLMGTVNGVVIARGKVAPFIATLATMTIFRGLTLVYTEGKPITGLPDAFGMIGRGYLLEIPMPVIWMLAAFGALYVILKFTSFGRHVFALGGNEEATRLSGINTNRVKILVYSISGLMASLSGIILTSRLNSAQPTAGTSYELDAIAAVVLGGRVFLAEKGGSWEP